MYKLKYYDYYKNYEIKLPINFMKLLEFIYTLFIFYIFF